MALVVGPRGLEAGDVDGVDAGEHLERTEMPLQRRGSGRRIALAADRPASAPALDSGKVRAVRDVVVLRDLASVQLVAVVVDRERRVQSSGWLIPQW